MLELKYKVYLLTYFAYAMNHACRMTLAYNKPNVKISYGLTPVHLGILDALVFIAYGIGSFFRYYFFGQRSLTRLYLISAISISSFFAVVPFICIFAQNQLLEHVNNGRTIVWLDVAIVLAMIGYGFSHLAAWQIVLALMSKYWHSKKEGSQMGFWTSMSCIGNIMAFLLGNFITSTLRCRWEVTMLLFAILNLLAALLMYFFLQDDKKDDSNEDSLSLSSSKQQIQYAEDFIEEDITTEECIEFNKNKFLGTWDFRLFIFISTCLKVLNYSFLFWYPSYLYVQGFQKISGYITMLFDIASIFGSYFVGKMMMYDKITCKRFGFDQSDDSPILKFFTIILKMRNVLMMLLSVTMSFLFLQNFGSLLGNILITILLGCTIGGIFHVNATFNSMSLGQHIPRNVDMVSNFSTAFGTIILGFFQLIIGILVNTQVPPSLSEKQVKHLKAWSYRNLFKVLIVMMLITAILMLFRSGVLKMLCQEKKDAPEAPSKQLKVEDKIKQQPKTSYYIPLSNKQI